MRNLEVIERLKEVLSFTMPSKLFCQNSFLFSKHVREEEMKCIICKSSEIELKMIEEEIKLEKDIVLVPTEVLVCLNCGERYYDKKTMRKLEEIRSKLREQDMEVEAVGKVLRAKVA
jgi:YgiT-type zinc finger domain-containing protein